MVEGSMLSCPSFRDRLYDEDARRALRGEALPPADLRAHRDACADCHREWEEAAADLATLPAVLLSPAPTAVVRKVRVGAAERLVAGPGIDWTEGVAWAAIGAALCAPATLLVPALGPIVLGLVGASFAFAASAARRVLREALR
jgi:hypothetical protein